MWPSRNLSQGIYISLQSPECYSVILHILTPHRLIAIKIIIISRRPRIDRSQIGQPMNFRHTGHVGSTDLGWEFQKIFRSALRPCHMDAIKDAIFDIWCEMFAFNAEFPLFFNNLSPSCQCASDHEGSNQANFLSSNSGLVLSNKICLLINLFKVKLSY